MILYFIPAEHRYVHRMADVPKGVEPKKVDIPTDLQGLMGFLNDLWAAHQIDLNLAMRTIESLNRDGPDMDAAINMEEEGLSADEAIRQIEALEMPQIRTLPTTLGRQGEVISVSTIPYQPTGTAIDVVSLIMDTEPAKFPPVLSATLERLGELRKEGVDGLRQFLKNNTAAERGIGALFVEAFK